MHSVSTVDSPFLQKPVALLDKAFELYGFIPVDEDKRWQFLSRYESLMRKARFRPMNFSNAWGATYLSDKVSYRSGFINSINPENTTQLERALDNIAHASEIADRYEVSQGGYQDYDIRLSMTDRLTNDPTRPIQDVTPCPEALHQIRLYDGHYIARVGFNVHDEEDASVLSIVNIQGTPGGSDRNTAFRKETGVSPFNLLVRRVLSLAHVAYPHYQVRGMINPERGNPRLYWGVLTEENVPLFHAIRK